LELGVRDVGIVDAKAISQIVPGLNCEDIVGGSFGRHDGFIDPLAVMDGFTRGALRNGATIESGVNAIAIKTENGRISGVETESGVIDCEKVVLCTGALAKQLAATAGVDLPVEPQRRQIVWARTAEPLPPNLPMVIDIGTGFHFRPARDFGNPVASHQPVRETRPPLLRHEGSSGSDPCTDVLFAYPDPDEPSSTNCEFDDVFVNKVYERAKHRAPFLFDTAVVRETCRAGLYENTPDHHAILGGCDVEGLYLANGFSGHGVMHSPATGRALSEIMLDGEASFLDVSCLSIERFDKGEMLHETAFI
jgi:sarcosine oxidase subunit beta